MLPEGHFPTSAIRSSILSYAQIAKELYVTRSTVAFHLSNAYAYAYAKTSTASRHEFVQLVRPPAVTARRRQAPSG
jgi:DNA-binding CsgD family transcriptional regulator